MKTAKRGQSTKAVVSDYSIHRKRSCETRNNQRSFNKENYPSLKASVTLENAIINKTKPPLPLPDIASRKYLDIKRWQCIARPQYSCSCGITTVVACWNYLFSVLGNGSLPYITVPEALKVLGYHQEIKKIRFFEIAINQNIMRWFRKLCDFYGVKGAARTYWKNTMTDTSGMLEEYIKDIKDPNKSFVYHCYKHYLTPIGYEITPKNPADVYTGAEKVSLEKNDCWMLIGESSRGYPGIHVVKWADVENDIMCDNKQVYNIRQRYKGLQKNKEKVNYHRLILLEKLAN